MRKRLWLNLPAVTLILRVALAVPLLALVYAGCAYLIAFLYSYLSHRVGPFLYADQHVAFLSFDFVDSLFTLGSWTSVYIGFHLLKGHQTKEKESRRLATALSQARLDQLRARVHPHFPFNALNALRGLIEESSPKAQDSVTRLTSILRYSLSSDANLAVPFGTELNAVSDYLELELLRFEGRLSVRKQIQPETLDRPIPPMLLQTLVENAVKYGAPPDLGISELLILATIDPADDRLCIRVENTGHLRNDERCPKGAGLRTAREQLQRLFGSDAELVIAENPPGVVRVAVSIPNRRPAAALKASGG